VETISSTAAHCPIMVIAFNGTKDLIVMAAIRALGQLDRY
jgi:hypothetical protein